MRLLLPSVLALVSSVACTATSPTSQLELPRGLHLTVFSDQAPSARETALGDKAVGDKSFITGFLQGRKTRGRPVDVQPMRDGSLWFSDDRGGAIYRVRYKNPWT